MTPDTRSAHQRWAPTPDEAWMGLLDCSDETHGDSLADDIAHHRPIIDAAYLADVDRLRAVPVDADRLARAWLNAMGSEHNEGCLDQGAMDCPVGAEVRDFVPLVVARYAALGDRAAEEGRSSLGKAFDAAAAFIEESRAAEEGR